MSWGTTFTAEIYLSRQTYGSEYEVDEAIKECKRMIVFYRERILMYAIAGKTAVPEKDENGYVVNPIDWIQCEMNRILEEYDSEQTKLYELYLLKENFDTIVEG